MLPGVFRRSNKSVVWVGGYESGDWGEPYFKPVAAFSTKEKAEEWLAWKKDVERLLDWEIEEYPMDPELVDRT